MAAFPLITVLCQSIGVVDGLPTVAGTLEVTLDDGRRLRLRQPDLLSALADLAQRRPVIDDGCGLVLDLLPSPSDSEVIALLVRLEPAGDDIGTRHTTSVALDTALSEAWSELQRYAARMRDDVLLDELLIPHTEHYSPGLAGRP